MFIPLRCRRSGSLGFTIAAAALFYRFRLLRSLARAAQRSDAKPKPNQRRIAQGLGRSPSTVSREIRRNGGCGAYRASEADRRAWERALRPKPCRLAHHAELRWRVAQKLALQWSPEQISGWLKRQFPADQGVQVSHEAIYRSLFIQTRGVLKKELMAHLRTARQMRQAKGGTTKSGLGQIVDTVSIRKRPAEPRIAPCQATGKETFSPERTTRTSRRSSSAILALRCFSKSRARTRRP
jgi:IS30 family transposase